MFKKHTWSFLLILILVFAIAITSIYQRGTHTFWKAGTVERIEPKEAQELLKKEELVILDARSTEEYAISHLPGAIQYTPDLLKTLNPSDPVLVYCTVSVRSNSLAKNMSELGFKEVYDIKGGLVNWMNDQQTLVNAFNEKTDTLHTYDKWLSPLLREGTPVY